MSLTTSATPTSPWYPPYKGFRLEEEAALHTYLKGLTTTDANGRSVPVQVWWTLPQREQREVTYPAIVLAYLGIERRTNEEHRGYLLTSGVESDTGNLLDGVMEQYPIPVYLRYQVTTLTRSNMQDVLLLQQLMRLLPFRFGQLTTAAGTVRRLDVLDTARPADRLTSDGQREFRKIWTIQISAEVNTDTFAAVRARYVNLTLTPN